MPWMMGLVIIMILILIPQRKQSKLKDSEELQEMKEYAKKSLKNTNEIITIRALRNKYRLSLVDSKKIMDYAKNTGIPK